MELSKHNIISKIADSDKYFIVNLLSKQADVLSQEEKSLFENGAALKNPDFIDRGYVVDPIEEEKNYKKHYLEFVDSRDTDEVQIFFVPNYACNFSCSYCYQDEYGVKELPIQEETITAFFNYVNTTFSDRKKYITVFGGEPLLNSKNQREFFNSFIKLANTYNIDLAIVTNGYNLIDYVDVLKNGSIREVQITLDGTKEMHDQHRMLKGGGSTFDQIVRGIDLCLENHLPVNLRMVLDKDNINELPKLASFAIEKGWTESPFFKTQIGRNYELHHCQSVTSRLYTRIEMYKDIYELLKSHPYITEFHKPAFSISKFLFEEGELPGPLFDSCPATKTEWAFDYTGKIYSCTATVGKAGEELGEYYPNVSLNEDIVCDWEDRDVLSIPECGNCELRLACGGGCASVAKNNKGRVNAPDCRPIKELLELGIAHYFKA